MARTFNPQFADLLSEAFSRTEIRPFTVEQEHIEEAIQSANYLLTQFSNKGVTQYQLVTQVITIVPGQATYDLMEGALDVWHAVYRRNDSDTPIWPFSRSDYHSIPDKDATGRPNQYFSDRGKVGLASRTVTLWPVPDTYPNDELRLWVWCRADTAGEFSADVPITSEFMDAYADGLALRLAKKFNRLKVAELKADFEDSFKIAFSAGRERTPQRLRMRGYTRGRRF